MPEVRSSRVLNTDGHPSLREQLNHHDHVAGNMVGQGHRSITAKAKRLPLGPVGSEQGSSTLFSVALKSRWMSRRKQRSNT